jgi:hypothetical protein
MLGRLFLGKFNPRLEQRTQQYNNSLHRHRVLHSGGPNHVNQHVHPAWVSRTLVPLINEPLQAVPQGTWQCVDARPSPCIGLKLLCVGTRSAWYRQPPPPSLEVPFPAGLDALPPASLDMPPLARASYRRRPAPPEPAAALTGRRCFFILLQIWLNLNEIWLC